MSKATDFLARFPRNDWTAADAAGFFEDGAADFYDEAADAGFVTGNVGVATGLGNDVDYSVIHPEDRSAIRYVEGDLYLANAGLVHFDDVIKRVMDLGIAAVTVDGAGGVMAIRLGSDVERADGFHAEGWIAPGQFVDGAGPFIDLGATDERQASVGPDDCWDDDDPATVLYDVTLDDTADTIAAAAVRQVLTGCAVAGRTDLNTIPDDLDNPAWMNNGDGTGYWFDDDADDEVETYEVTLRIDSTLGDPAAWDWACLLDQARDEVAIVSSTKVDERAGDS